MSEASAASGPVPQSRVRVRAPAPPMSNPSKVWIFTVNNPEDHGVSPDEPRAWFEQSGAIAYVVYAYERGRSGTPHIQGYLRLKKAQRRSWVSTRLCRFARWEIARGSCSHNQDYVYKRGAHANDYKDFIRNPIELGVPPKQGKRNDLSTALELVRHGATDRQLFEDVPGAAVRYLRSFQQYRLLCQPPRDFKTFVHVMYGSTGTGKSARARIIYGDAYYIAFSPTGLWWDGYEGGDVVIDDYKGGIPLHVLLRLLDQYKMSVSVRGALVNFAPPRIVITSSKHPRDWYDWQKLDEDPNQLLRRIDLLENITTDGAIRDQRLKDLKKEATEHPLILYTRYSGVDTETMKYAPIPRGLAPAAMVDLTQSDDEEFPLGQGRDDDLEEVTVVPATPEPNPPYDDSWIEYDSDMDEGHIWPDDDISADDVSDSSVGSSDDEM